MDSTTHFGTSSDSFKNHEKRILSYFPFRSMKDTDWRIKVIKNLTVGAFFHESFE